MKKALRIILPVVLTIAIVFCLIWYLFVYDRGFTRDVLLSAARFSETQGNLRIATWFYNAAYAQSGNNDSVAIELAEQYKSSGNYTKAEYTLSNAIADGGGLDLYVALCKTYVEQDKLLDAVNMLNSITDPQIKSQLEAMRPAAPTASPEPGFYNQYISVTLSTDKGTIYSNANGIYPSTQAPAYSDPIALQDGENNVFAVAVAENGLVSPLSIYGYVVGGVVKELTFSDPAIESSVRQILMVDDTKTLLTNDLWTIKNYTVPEQAKSLADLAHMSFLETLELDAKRDSDLSFLSSLSNLTELTIRGASVSNDVLAAIAALPKLKKLSLTDCNITSLAPLAPAKNLTHLDLSNNAVLDITALGSMTLLTELNVSHNAIADISTVSALTALTTLNVSNNSITSLSAVSNLTGLVCLDASVNSIAELGQIGNLKMLSTLYLSNNQLSNIAAIGSCAALTDLKIATNQITDISGLSALTNLMYLDFSYNQVTELPSFAKDCALVTIDGSNNNLKKLDNLGGLHSLNSVFMDYNASLSSVKPLAKCHLLVEVNVYGTKVKDVSSLTAMGVVVNYKPS